MTAVNNAKLHGTDRILEYKYIMYMEYYEDNFHIWVDQKFKNGLQSTPNEELTNQNILRSIFQTADIFRLDWNLHYD